MKKSIHCRRDFLKFLSKSALSVPFLPSLFTHAEAASIQFPKRLIVLFSSNGQFEPDWYPTRVQAGDNRVPLASIPGPISNILGTDFDEFRDRMLLLRGLDMIPVTDEHWGSKSLSGFGQTYNRMSTIDQIVCRSPAVYSREPQLRSLVAKAGGIPGSSRLLGAGYSQAPVGNDTMAIVPQLNPESIFDRLFFSVETYGQGISVLDQLGTQYKRLLSSSRLSLEDKYRLEAHLGYLNETAKKFAEIRPTSCNPSNLGQIGSSDSYQNLVRDHMNLIAAAIKCDLTRVVRLNLTESADLRNFQFIPGVEPKAFHNLTHSFDSNAQNSFKLIQQWLAKQVAYLLSQLNEVEDPATGRTYLDNSIIYWANESGVRPNDNPNNVHDDLDLPCLLIGGGQGFFKPGYFVDYRQLGVARRWESSLCEANVCTNDQNHNFIGRPINELLITLMLSMGLAPSEWEIAGTPGFGDYSDNFGNQYDVRDKRRALPLIVA